LKTKYISLAAKQNEIGGMWFMVLKVTQLTAIGHNYKLYKNKKGFKLLTYMYCYGDHYNINQHTMYNKTSLEMLVKYDWGLYRSGTVLELGYLRNIHMSTSQRGRHMSFTLSIN
jgi:maltoporin